MNVTSKISVDLTRQCVGVRVNAVQGDGNTRLVEITLLSGGAPWTPPEGVEAAIAYMQPGGAKGMYNLLADGTAAISMAGNVATIILAPQMLTASGTVQASLVFNDAQLNRLTTFPFSVSVASNPAAGAQKTEDYIRLQWLEDKMAEYLAEIKASGAFDGRPGDPGRDYDHSPEFTALAAEMAGYQQQVAEDRQQIADAAAAVDASAKAAAGSAGISAGAQQAAEGAATAAAKSAEDAERYAEESQQAVDSLRPEVSQIKDDLSDNAKADAETRRKLDYLWKLNQGISYQFETDDAAGYSKTVPTGAKLASVEAVGGKTVVWNQLVRKTTSTSASGVTMSVTPERSMVTLTGTMEATNFGVFNTNIKERINAVPGHWYYSSFSGSACEKSRHIASTSYSIRDGSTTYQPQIKQYTGSETLSAYVQLYAEIGTVFENDDLIGVVVDLTQLFGSGNEPTSTDDPRIAWIEKHAAEHPEYNARELVSADVESVKYHDVVVTEIPEEVRNLYGYGWSAGDVCNAISRTDTGWRYVQRVGSREYQDGDTVTDGVTTYYALDNPVITDITNLMNGALDAIPVEVGGTLTFDNAAKLPVPSSVEYLISLAEVNG